MIFRSIIEDIKAIYRNDPAAKNIEFLLYPGFHAIFFHRFWHFMYRIKIPFLPRLFSQITKFFTGVEIHPGATIGKGFFIDHGSGVVIGETAEIGDNCVLFHNVTLGGTGKHVGKRHPVNSGVTMESLAPYVQGRGIPRMGGLIGGITPV